MRICSLTKPRFAPWRRMRKTPTRTPPDTTTTTMMMISTFFADDDECTSPLDDIDTFITFSDFLNELGSMGDRAGALQAIQSQADANAKVQNLMQYVEVRRVEFPKEREEAKSK
mmetsp:Transcript_5574/g.18750  ORF Transcript_5574/g.18750 Transcript_5574/m.18750 type:complete len:114 (+) Transcript_5574:2850-3191(+)